MTDLVPLLAGAAVAAFIARSGLAVLPTRENFRGRAVAIPAGAIAVAASLLALAPLALLEGLGVERLLADPDDDGNFLVLFGALDRVGGFLIEEEGLVFAPLFVGVAFLGLLDDLFEGEPRGWRGHFGAVLRGGFSTGVLKAAGTLALAAAVFRDAGLDAGEFLLAVAVVALTTNLFNLLDLRPGRAVKAWVLLAVPLTIAEPDGVRLVGLFAGPLLVLGLYDLRERAMLGDTGSNVLGALAGLWLVVALDTTGQLIALAVLLALTAYGELRSFSAAIDRVAPLRALDRLGRPQDAG